MKFLLRTLVVTGLLLGQAALAANKPLEHFFKKPEFASFQLSPDGKSLAALIPMEGRMNLAVIDLATRKANAVTAVKKQDLNGFMWANNSRLLFFMDDDGNESFGVFAVNMDGSKSRTLVEPLAARGSRVLRYTNVVHRLPSDDEHVIVVDNARRAERPDLYKMNIFTGKKKLIKKNPGDASGWILDWDGDLAGANYDDGVYAGFRTYDAETDTWEKHTYARFDEPNYGLAGVTDDPEVAYVASTLNPDGSARDKSAIFEYNIKTKQIGNLVYEHDVVDVGGVAMSSKSRKMIGVGYMAEKPQSVYFDDAWQAHQDGLDQALPDMINGFASMDDDESIAVVASYSSDQPVTYYLYDMNKRTLEFLAPSRPWVEKGTMAVTKPIELKARDGRTLHGYLTLPHGSDGKNIPLVMNPHGGPWARDGYGYNSEHQFLADRGYGVLQVNFRGSTGYGRDHLLSAVRQWGQTMQHDITDAVKWAIDQGIADKDRVAIYGGSYGGYAVMAGLTYTPDLYKCGVNIVGVTNIPLLFKTMPDSWEAQREQMVAMVGDPKKDKEFLQQWSPSNHADKIKVPVLMAYGKRDIRVDLKHAKVMQKAMKRYDVEHELVVYKDEGHGFRKTENQLDFYGRVEKFLAANL